MKIFGTGILRFTKIETEFPDRFVAHNRENPGIFQAEVPDQFSAGFELKRMGGKRFFCVILAVLQVFLPVTNLNPNVAPSLV